MKCSESVQQHPWDLSCEFKISIPLNFHCCGHMTKTFSLMPGAWNSYLGTNPEREKPVWSTPENWDLYQNRQIEPRMGKPTVGENGNIRTQKYLVNIAIIVTSRRQMTNIFLKYDFIKMLCPALGKQMQ